MPDDEALGPTLTGNYVALETTAATPEAHANTTPAIESAASIASERLPLALREDFLITTEIGRGGLGRVLRARDPLFGRPIAIKELLSDHHDARARFLREAMITARLQHPAIVPIYIAGRWPSGAPFYGMKLVEGRSLAEELRQRTTLAERLALLPSLIATCDAIAYAHRNRVLHRDLKPGNVLLGDFGETIVIDWGLAKHLDADDDAAPTATDSGDGVKTVAGAVLGTPAYMPPEQATGRPSTEQSDVYSLGAMLYELLTGAIPYAESKSAREVLDRLSAGPPRPIAIAVRDAPRDLVAIAERAMARDPSARYRDAAQLATDLRRFQTGQLVSVRSYGIPERVLRWMRRHRAAVTVGAVALVALVIVGVIAVASTVRSRQRAEREAASAEVERRKAVDRSDDAVLANAVGAVETDPAKALAWLAHLSPHSRLWPRARIVALDAFDARPARLLAATRAGLENVHLDDRAKTVVASTIADAVVIYDLATGHERVLDLPPDAGVRTIHNDLVAFGGPTPGLIRIADGATTHLDPHGSYAWPTVSGNSAWVALSTDAGVVVRNVATGAERIVPGALGINYAVTDKGALVVMERDAKSVVVHEPDGRIRPIGIPTAVRQSPRIGNYEFAPTGELVFVQTVTTIGVIDTVAGTWTLIGTPGSSLIVSLIDAKGRSFIATAPDYVARWDHRADGTWDIGLKIPNREQPICLTGKQVVVRDGANVRIYHDGEIEDVRLGGETLSCDISEDGGTLVMLQRDGTLRHWQLGHRSAEFCGSEPVLEISHETTYFAQSGGPGRLLVCDVATGTQHALVGFTEQIESAALSANGQFALVRGTSGTVAVWSATGPTRSLELDIQPGAITNDGASVIAIHRDDVVSVDVATRAMTVRCPGFAAAYIGRAARYAVRLRDGALEVCTIASGRVARYPWDKRAIDRGTLWDDAALLFAGREAVLWDLRSGTQTPIKPSTRGGFGAFAVGHTHFVISEQGLARIFDMHGDATATIPTRSGDPQDIALSPDDEEIAIADYHDVFVESIASKLSRRITGLRDVGGIQFNATGVITIAREQHRLYHWPDTIPRTTEELEVWVRTATTLAVDADGTPKQ